MLVNVDRIPLDHGLVEIGPPTERPVLWEDVIWRLGVRLSCAPPQRNNLKRACTRDAISISWGPSAGALVAALLRRPLVYFCWGMPKSSRYTAWNVIRLLRLKFL